MTQLVTIVQEAAYWIALAVALAGVWMSWLPAFRSKQRMLLVVATGALSLHVAARWVLTGHPFVYGGFENSIAAAWFVFIACLFARRWHVAEQLPVDFERWFSLLAPVFLVLGVFFDRTPVPTAASLQGLLFYSHVLLAWMAHTLLLAATIAGGLLLARRDGWESDAVDALMVRATGAGFALFTAMAVAGAAYSYALFANWYRWEIVEAFTLGAWLVYSTLLHGVMLFQWRGRRLAWGLVLALPLLIGTFWVWSVYSGTYHHFGIPTVR